MVADHQGGWGVRRVKTAIVLKARQAACAAKQGGFFMPGFTLLKPRQEAGIFDLYPFTGDN